jgi:electron transfer flavoprotein alpha subunit
VSRQQYGGKIDVRLTMRSTFGLLLTVRPGCLSAEPGQVAGTEIETVAAPPWPSPRRRRLLELVEAVTEDVDISAADILVAVGRGVGSEENLSAVQAFADAIGATLACSRPVADKGWLPKSRQVGTSGKVVRPKIYLALGISGAYQHAAGMRGAGTIIAVNTDPSAPIFDVAHYGIVADLFEVLPLLQERFG